MAVCGQCGVENCEKKRAAFMREPFLPGGFEVGAQWTSFDGGNTWERFPEHGLWGNRFPVGHMTVTDVDQKTGVVTVVTAFKVPG
jgi:hypothetical protein